MTINEALMPKFTFENKITWGNALTVLVLIIGGITGWYALSSTVAASAMAISDVRAQVQSQGDQLDSVLMRLPVVERNQVTGKEAREAFQNEAKASLEALRSQNVLILQALATLTARLDERDRIPK